MAAQVEQLSAAVAALADAWAGALPPLTDPPQDLSAAVGEMNDPGLVAVLAAVGEVTKRAEVMGAVVAGEIARRSPREAGSQGLARRAGYGTPGRMVAESRGGKVGRAVELVKVGEGTASRLSLTGEVLPAVHPHVAEALHAARIGVDAAHLIISMLDRVSPRANPVELEAAEEFLAQQASEFPLAQLEKLVKYAEARLDPDGLEPKEEDQYASRSLVMREDARGMLHLRGIFDPVTGAPIKLALQQYAEARMREARGLNAPHQAETAADAEAAGAGGEDAAVAAGQDTATAAGQEATTASGPASSTGAGDASAEGQEQGAPVQVETRTIAQLQADALSDFIRHIGGCEDTRISMPAVTMVVRVDLEDLEGRAGGSGIATIDSIDQPISAGAARRIAANAKLIPAVFGTSSIPLDLGRQVRTFTRPQVLALWERDGGCAMCGQTTFVEAHHVRWWVRHGGCTDLGNGVLLCSRCHHVIHRDEWDITIHIETGQVLFYPPAHVDPERRPRRAAANPRSRADRAA